LRPEEEIDSWQFTVSAKGRSAFGGCSLQKFASFPTADCPLPTRNFHRWPEFVDGDVRFGKKLAEFLDTHSVTAVDIF